MAAAASWRRLPSAMALLCSALLAGAPAGAEDELAQYAKEGNKVGVDAKCFVQKCSLPTHECLNNPDCLKGLSCLSKCVAGSQRKAARACLCGCV
jgi:hypothetical protein